jgi:hypothetical protein
MKRAKITEELAYGTALDRLTGGDRPAFGDFDHLCEGVQFIDHYVWKTCNLCPLTPFCFLVNGVELGFVVFNDSRNVLLSLNNITTIYIMEVRLFTVCE